MAFWRRVNRRRATTPDPHEAARVWWKALEPLGPFRQQVIACLSGDTPFGEPRFSAEDGQDLFDAFRRFVIREQDRGGPTLDAIGDAVLATGRLLVGDLVSADRIVDLLPEAPHVTDHGAGKCLLMPARVLRNVLPWPENVGDPDRWVARSPEQAALRAWLTENRARLTWEEAKGRYEFAS